MSGIFQVTDEGLVTIIWLIAYFLVGVYTVKLRGRSPALLLLFFLGLLIIQFKKVTPELKASFKQFRGGQSEWPKAWVESESKTSDKSKEEPRFKWKLPVSLFRKHKRIIAAFVILLGIGTLFGLYNSFLKTKVYELSFGAEFTELELSGEIFDSSEISLGKVEANIFETRRCLDGEYSFLPDLNGYVAEATVYLNCSSRSITFNADDLALIALLDFTRTYTDSIIYDDPAYRAQALELVSSCSSGDIPCYVDKIYKHFATNIKYIGDVRDSEHIEGVAKTLETGIGDCEDISIVISSFLENLGINTKMIFMENHAYTLVCDLDYEQTKKYIPENQPFVSYPFSEYSYCFALDGTLGEDAYIGFDAGYGSEKFLVDPVTKQYAFLGTDEGIVDMIWVPAYISVNKKDTYTANEKGQFFLTGTTSENCEKIVVNAYNINGINDEYQLTSYKKGDTSFKYGVSEEWDNMAEGINTYTFTAYCSGDQIVSDYYSLNYDPYTWEDYYNDYYNLGY